MDKLKLAHDWAIELLRSGDHSDDVVSCAWKYADAMQAEADKRKPSGLPEALKEEWQPDWSQAPEGFDWWAQDKWGSYWYDQEPKWIRDEWGGYIMSKNNRSATEKAPSFNYQGNWQDSLRERPQ